MPELSSYVTTRMLPTVISASVAVASVGAVVLSVEVLLLVVPDQGRPPGPRPPGSCMLILEMTVVSSIVNVIDSPVRVNSSDNPPGRCPP